MKNNNTRKLVMTGIFSAVASVLMMLEFSVPFMPEFIKLDLSELPAIIISFAVGPVWGVAVCLIKNLLHLPFSTTQFIGELANFILGALFVLPAGIIYKIRKKRTFAVIGLAVGTLLMSGASLLTNYYITYPFYQNFMPLEAIIGAYQTLNPAVSGLWSALIMFNLPFNIFKGALCSAITFIIYKKLSPVINGKQL